MEYKLLEILGILRDKVPGYDIRRLYNLRSFLLQTIKLNSSHLEPPIDDDDIPNESGMQVQRSDMIMSKMENILGDTGKGLPRSLILELIYEPTTDTLSLSKLEILIDRIEKNRMKIVHKDIKSLITKIPEGVKARDKMHHPPLPDWEEISTLLSYLLGFFELKFKKGLYEAFKFFEHNEHGKITEIAFIRGFHKLGIDSISIEEMKQIFRYLDHEGKGEIGIEEFKDL